MPLNRLQNIGFRSYGPVTPHANFLCLTVGAVPLPDHFLFCISSNGSLLCMGFSTVEKLLPQGDAPTQYRLSINPNILASLEGNHPLEFFIFHDAHLLQIGEFKVNLTAGLKVSLLENFPNTWVEDVRLTEIANASELQQVVNNRNSFPYKLNKSLRQNGQFRVPDKYRHLFKDFKPYRRSNIAIQLGENNQHRIQKQITRRGTPRHPSDLHINGGIDLKRYFQQFQVGDMLLVTVDAPHQVKISRQNV